MACGGAVAYIRHSIGPEAADKNVPECPPPRGYSWLCLAAVAIRCIFQVVIADANNFRALARATRGRGRLLFDGDRAHWRLCGGYKIVYQ